MLAKTTLNVIVIENPFDISKRRLEEVQFIHGLSVAGYITGYDGEYVASLNGGIVESEDEALTFPSPGDTMVLCPVPMGGGDGVKGILRSVAMIVLTVYTGGLTSGLLGASLQVTQGALLLGGTMLINAILPPSAPSSPSSPDNPQAPTTYGLDGAKNASSDGIPVPICYGGYRMAGSIIALHTENITDTQFVYVLINAGEGAIAGIDSILLNDQPIGNFKDVTVQTRLGVDNQPLIDWFGETLRAQSVARKVTDDWSYFDTTSELDKLRLDFVFPKGLVTVGEKDGKYRSRSVTLEVEIQEKGTSKWVSLNHEDFSGNLGPTARAYYDDSYSPDGSERLDSKGNIIRGSNGSYVGYWWKEPLTKTGITFSNNSTKVMRRSIKSRRIKEAEYRVRWRRTNKEANGKYEFDEVTITDINEILTDGIGYNFTALLAVRIRLTDQLNSLPNITFINGGRVCRVFNDATNKWVNQATSNPAWIVLDALTSSRFGGGMLDSRVDMPKLKEWARWCDYQKLTFRGVIEGSDNIWDQLSSVFRAGHAKPVMYGTKFSFSIEKPSDPAMMFSESSVISGTFSMNWMDMADRANEVEVTFFDETDDFKRKTIKLYDSKALIANTAQRSTSITLKGCVKEKDALYEAQLALDMNRHIRQTVSFEAALSSIACVIGDVIFIQHNMPQWGYGGLTKAGSTKSEIHLDISEGDLLGQVIDTILIHVSAKNKLSGVVTNVIGNVVFVDGFSNNLGAVKRLICNDEDIQIIDVVNYGNIGWGVELDNIASVSVGKQVSIWDTDVIEERTISKFEDNKVTLSSPLSMELDRGVEFILGRSGKSKKLFRVTAIEYSHEYTRKIEAIEYNPTILDRYKVVVPTVNASIIPTLSHSKVTDTQEQLVKVGPGVLKTQLSVFYSNNSDVYIKSDVLYRKNSEAYALAGTHHNQITFDVEEGEIYDIKVVAIDAAGKRKEQSLAPVFTYEVKGKTTPPENVQDFRILKTKGGLSLRWTQNSDIDLQGYVVRQGVSWDSNESENILSATSLFVAIDKPGSYRFHIRALDTSGNLSDVSTAEIEISRPKPVTTFSATQNAQDVIFMWKKPADSEISEYEIRVGKAWSGSQFIARVDSTTYRMNLEGYGERTFWIKTIDSLGLESETARFYSLAVIRTPDRNLVFESKDDEKLYPGVKYGSYGSGALIMTPGATYSEYLSLVSLPKRTMARNVISMDVSALASVDALTWGEADFTWDDSRAARLFESITATSNTGAVSVETQISVKMPPRPGEVHSLSLSGKLQSEQGDQPIEAASIDYQAGRFAPGLKVTDFTKLSYQGLSIPSEFSLRFWITPTDETMNVSGMFMKAETDSGSLSLIYSDITKEFILEDHRGDRLKVKEVFSKHDRILVGISQTEGERRLMVGKIGASPRSSEGGYSPIGEITSYKLTT